MTTCYLAPDPIQSCQLIPGGNTPANGGQLFFYAAGSSTKQTVYKDSNANTAWSNPIVLDSGGNLPSGGEVWFPTGQTFKVVFAPSTDTDPPASPYWTKDNLAGMNDVSGSQSEWISGPTPTFVNATQFTLSGDQTGTFTVGRRIKTTNTGGTVYGTITRSVFGALTTVTLQNDSGSLDSGLSAVFYGIISADHPSSPAATVNAQPMCCGRLSVSSATAVLTADVASSAALFFVPFRGNTIDIYDGTANWNRFTFAQVSTAVPNTSNTVYDATIYNSSGVLALSSTAWSSVSTRTVALATQNGVLVLSGATGQRYLGTYKTTNTSGQVDDTAVKRFVWNYYNRVSKSMLKTEATSTWTYSTAAYRQANASAANQISYVVGVEEDPITARVQGAVINSGATVRSALVNIGIDGTTAAAKIVNGATVSNSATLSAIAFYQGFPGAGAHDLKWLEFGGGADDQTWIGTGAGINAGTISGIFGEIRG